MRAKKFAATALLAIAATGVATGVAAAQPVLDRPAAAVQGTDHGVGFIAAPTSDRTGVTATVTDGRFGLAPDARSITLTDGAGAVVATVPLGVHTITGTIGLTPRIDNAGHTLTLTPQAATAQTTRAIDDASDTLARKQYNAGVGAAIGGGIGAVLGFFLGGVGALITVPIGAGIGALIGYSTP